MISRSFQTAEGRDVVRLTGSGLVVMAADKAEGRKTLVQITPDKEKRLRDFAAIHLRPLGEQQ